MSREENGQFESLLLGGLIGAALGLLLAPAAGEATREQVKQKIDEFDLDEVLDRLKEAFAEGKEEMMRVIKEVEM